MNGPMHARNTREVLGQHRWTQAAADTVVLDFDDRHRRRMAMIGTRGLEFLLDLENAIALRGGDALVLEDGRLIEVVAAAEPLIEIRGTDPLHLVRVAWHLGNRHLPTQIMPKGLRIRRDHVIEAMVKGLGARIIEIEAPFDPEGGAYAGHAHAPEAAPAHTGHDHASHDHAAHDHGHHHHDDHGTTIIMTSIAITIITTTITPMLMTTSEPVPPDARSGMTDDEAAALYRLMTWLSPAFPVGAFSYSSGIEWAVEAGDITDAASLREWLAAMLADGSGFCDGVFLAQAHRAASAHDDAGLREIAELAAAFVPSRERQLETSTQGRAFIEIARAAWALRRAGGADRGLRRRNRLSRSGRPRQRRARHSAGADHACVPARTGLELDFRRQPAGAARADRQPAHSGGPRAGRGRDREARAASLARRSRQRDVSRRSRQPAPRDAVYAAVPVMRYHPVVPRTPGPIPRSRSMRRYEPLLSIESRRMGPGVRRDDNREKF